MGWVPLATLMLTDRLRCSRSECVETADVEARLDLYCWVTWWETRLDYSSTLSYQICALMYTTTPRTLCMLLHDSRSFGLWVDAVGAVGLSQRVNCYWCCCCFCCFWLAVLNKILSFNSRVLA